MDHVGARVSLKNQEIGRFFNGKPKNSQRIEWVDLSIPRALPIGVREIRDSLATFFAKKQWYAGGPIPPELLYTKRNFHLVNNVALLDAIEIGYRSIERSSVLAKTKYKKNVDTNLALRVIRWCERSGIMQDHIGGLFLLYLELCEKVALL